MATVAGISSLGGSALNPRGNIWLNDDSTFGHKLLMKMGWSKGKGLGKNEDGIKENIKVKFKSTSSGVGFKDESFFNMQNTEYDSLLKSISENCAHHEGAAVAKEKVEKHESLEQRSQIFRNRLRYRKFVRGKDLSNYSEKDMKSIFIMSETSEENMESVVEGNTVSVKEEFGADEKLPELISTNTSKLTISDYFAQKMKRKKFISSELANNDSDLQLAAPDSKVGKENATQTNTSNSSVKKKRKRNELSTNNEDSISVIIVKKNKSKKHKSKHWKALKSCLRNKNGKYCVKNVTFDESVSYHLIEPICKTECESSTLVNNPNNQEGNAVIAGDMIENCNKNDTSVIEKIEVNEKNDNTTLNIEVENNEEEDVCSLSNLPNRKSDYFNGWIESQRQAMKMKHYKNMLKSIKRHEILKTSNLLFIRGYGNWGY